MEETEIFEAEEQLLSIKYRQLNVIATELYGPSFSENLFCYKFSFTF